MKRSPALACVVSLVASVLAGCTSTKTGIESRIAEKSAVYEQLRPEVQKNIREGTIEPGYTADMVYMALGAPSKVRVKDTSSGKVGIWTYANFFPEGYETAPAYDGSERSETAAPATSAFVQVGSSDYGSQRTVNDTPSYTDTQRRGFKPWAVATNAPRSNASLDQRVAAMEPLDVPDMDSASLYVVFHEGRVVQMKLGRN